MEFRVLGPVEALGPDGALVTGGHRQRLLLAHLLVRANHSSRARPLIDLLWDEEPPEGARNALQVSISPSGGRGRPDRDEGFGLRRARRAGELDLSRFEELVRDGRALVDADPRTRADTLREALELWRGPAFADLADERSLQGEIARLTELRSLAEEERISSDLALGHPPRGDRRAGIADHGRSLARTALGHADARALSARAAKRTRSPRTRAPGTCSPNSSGSIRPVDSNGSTRGSWPGSGLSLASGHAPVPSGREDDRRPAGGSRIGGYKILDVLGAAA
jgi:hypothetical protein